jgi:hypothetical protein
MSIFTSIWKITAKTVIFVLFRRNTRGTQTKDKSNPTQRWQAETRHVSQNIEKKCRTSSKSAEIIQKSTCVLGKLLQPKNKSVWKQMENSTQQTVESPVLQLNRWYL